MMAGVYLARAGHEVHILEKNEKLGKKVYITGKGRCNVTNNCDTEELFRAVMSNPKFLYSAFYSFTPQDVMEFFEEAGVPLKTERGNRVFPVSDHSSDIIRGLERELFRMPVSPGEERGGRAGHPAQFCRPEPLTESWAPPAERYKRLNGGTPCIPEATQASAYTAAPAAPGGETARRSRPWAGCCFSRSSCFIWSWYSTSPWGTS